MVKDKNGRYITEYSVVLFSGGGYYCVESVDILEPYWVRLRNGCVHAGALPEHLVVID
jgi:hypothetical protein